MFDTALVTDTNLVVLLQRINYILLEEHGMNWLLALLHQGRPTRTPTYVISNSLFLREMYCIHGYQ